MNRTIFLSSRSLAAVALAALVWVGCSDNRGDLTAPDDLGPNISVVSQAALDYAIRVQERHTAEMMEKVGVVGTAVGLGEDGRPTVLVFLTEEGIAEVPESRDGVPFEGQVTGPFSIFPQDALSGPQGDPTVRFPRPVPIGVSTGHPSITAGTIGARVKDGGGNLFALSNNHVYAASNAATIGDAVIQPGTFDGGSSPADDIGNLSAFVPITFCVTFPTNCAPNVVDAAIAATTTGNLSNRTPHGPNGGYGRPRSTTLTATVGMPVMKYGRTTRKTTGTVTAINASVFVNYGAPGIALFLGQIVIGGQPGFSAGGDSGSLVVNNKGRDRRKPVGLLYAGSATSTILNPIGPVLSAFGVTIDGQ